MMSSRMDMDDGLHCLFEQRGGVAVVTMNRPEAKNAVTRQMLARLYDAWVRINEDNAIRVAILTGAGGAFSAGADLKALAHGNPKDKFDRRFQEDPLLGAKGFLRSYHVTKPLIAAVEGPAIAGGTEILQATDIRIAAQSARFGISEVRWGLFPLMGSTVRLRRQIPYARAADLLLTGRHVGAAEALEIGLVSRVVPDGEALAVAWSIAEVIVGNGPLAVQAVKRSLRETEGVPEQRALEIEFAIGRPIFETQDAREGPLAFAEKRAPKYRGC